MLAVDELVRRAIVRPAHVGKLIQKSEYGIEFQQILLGLRTAKRLCSVSIDISQIAFGALRNLMRHARILLGSPG